LLHPFPRCCPQIIQKANQKASQRKEKGGINIKKRYRYQYRKKRRDTGYRGIQNKNTTAERSIRYLSRVQEMKKKDRSEKKEKTKAENPSQNPIYAQ
jgi:hypothetical protein